MSQIQINLDDFRINDYSNRNSFIKLLHNHFGWPWKALEFIEFFLLGALGIAHCAVFATHINRDIVGNDIIRNQVLKTLVILCPITGIYGMVFFKLKSHLWINLGITLFLAIIPVLILAIIIGMNLFINYISISVACAFVFVSSTGLAVYRMIRRILLNKIGYYWGGALSISFLLVCNTLFSLLVSILIVDSDTLANPKRIVSYISVLYLIFLCLIWFAIHSIIFTRHPNEIQALKKEILDLENPSLSIQSLLNKYPDLLKNSNPDFFSTYGHILASFSILISTIGVEIGAITIFSSDKYPNSAIYISGFYIMAIPCFIFIGTIFSTSSLNKNDKYCIALLFLTAIPTILIMWVSFYMYQNQDFHYLGLLISIGFPSTILYWLSLTMIYNYNKRSYQYFSAICCLVAVIPLGLMWPLYSAGGMKTITFWVVCGVLIFGGAIVLVLWLVQFVFRLSKELVLLIKEVRKFNGYDLAQYLYSVSFVLGFCLLGFFTFKRLDYANDWIGGFVPGCFTILGFMIFGTVLIHRVILYISETGIEEPNIRDIILGTAPPNTELQIEFLKKKKKLQGLISISGILISCSISLPILILSKKDSSISVSITIIAGFIISSIVLISFIEIKSVLRQFGEIVISYALGCCWIFCLFPLFCLIPLSLSSSESEEDLRSVTSWSIGTMLLIFMFGVSFGSITLNLLFRRLEYEKIAKYCCEQVREKLIENGVRANLTTLRSIYDNFRTSGSESVEKVLVNATVFYYHEIENDADLWFSKEILTLREISKIKSPKIAPAAEKKDKVQSKGMSFMLFIRKLCTNKDEEGVVQVTEVLKPEELMGIEMPEMMHDNKIMDEKETIEEKNWDQQFKEIAERQEELENNIKNNIELEKELEISYEELNKDLENIQEVQLDSKKLQELIACKHLKNLNSSDQTKKKWLKAVFRRFSHGVVRKGGKPWMTLSDLRHFLRLSGMKAFISNVNCDLLYVRLTRVIDRESMKKIRVKLDFKMFSGTLFKQLGKLIFGSLSYEDAENKVFSEIIYPNLVSNLQYLNKYCPLQFSIKDDNQFESIQLFEENKHESKNYDRLFYEGKSIDDQSLFINHTPSQYVLSVLSGNDVIQKSEIFIKQSVIKKIEKPKFLFCKKLMERFSNGVGKCIKGILSCMGKGFDLCFYWLMPTSKSSEEILSKKKSSKTELISEKPESPSWEVICNIIVTSFYSADKEARENINEKHPQLQFNISNIIGIIGHLLEIFSFSSVGFLKQVGWIYGSSLSKASSAILADNDYWVQTYWTCFSSSLIFFILVFPAIKYIKKGRLGLNEDLTTANFPKFQFFLSKLISLFGKTMYLTILSSMLSSFSCVYEEDNWRLLRNSEIICFSHDHEMYFILGILSLLIYYPFATLLFPNIAFQNKALDIKFDTTYLVLESQGKVVIAAVAAFFAVERYIWLQLIVSIFVSGVLLILNLKLKPCLIKSYNMWKAGGFVVPIWVCSCGLLNYYSGQNLLALCLLITGIGVILGVLLALHRKLYGFNWLSRLNSKRKYTRSKKVFEESKNHEKAIDGHSRSELNITGQTYNI